jgi:hypothetical protein
MVRLVVATATYSLFSGNAASDAEFWSSRHRGRHDSVGRARAAQRAAVADT